MDGVKLTAVYGWIEATLEQKQFVGRLIKESRVARDLSTTQAASEAGISRSAFYRWENGRIASSTALLMHWLLKDSASSHDVVYWRERAMMAEAALDGLDGKLQRYYHNKAEIVDE